MPQLFLLVILICVLVGLIAYSILWLKDRQAEDISANRETYSQFRTTCLQMILRSVSTGFCVSIKDMTVEQNQSDWDFNWTSITFDDWIVWVTVNWRSKICRITCFYERDDHQMMVKKFSMRIIHNTIDESALIQKLEKINSQGYKFALPTNKEKAIAVIKDAHNLANEEEITDEELFNIMYSAWSRLPYKTKREAEDFIRITAFLFRYHLEEMINKTKIEVEKEDR